MRSDSVLGLCSGTGLRKRVWLRVEQRGQPRNHAMTAPCRRPLGVCKAAQVWSRRLWTIPVQEEWPVGRS